MPGYNCFKEGNVHLIWLQDGTVVKIVDDGGIVFCAAVDRVELNKKGAKEIEYFWH